MPKDAQFDQLYRSHYRRVHGLCRQLLGRSGSADDATQEVFMRAYRSFGRYDPSQPFAGWILTIAGNYCVDLLRRGGKESRLFADEAPEHAEAQSEDPSAIDALIAFESATALKSAVAALPDKYRVPLVLAYYEEASYERIADALGVTRNHVGVLILRAKQALRRELGAGHALDVEQQGESR